MAETYKDDVKLWVLDYACRHQHTAVLEASSANLLCDPTQDNGSAGPEAESTKAISECHDGVLCGVGIPAIRLAEAALLMIVTKERLEDFDEVIKVIQYIHETVPTAVPFKVYAKLVCGLKMKALFHMLSSGKLNILEKLNEYFPRSSIQGSKASKTRLSKLNSSQFQFRKFFLVLLANEKQRLAYLQNEYLEEYGEQFMNCLKSLVASFIEAVEKQLPPTLLEKLMNGAADGVNLEERLRQRGVQSAELEILLDTLIGQTKLTSEAVLELLTLVSPLNTQDRVLLYHPAPFIDPLDSFSEDSGTDQTPPMDNTAIWVTQLKHVGSVNRQKTSTTNCDSSKQDHSVEPLDEPNLTNRNTLNVTTDMLKSTCVEDSNHTTYSDAEMMDPCVCLRFGDNTVKNKSVKTWCTVPLTMSDANLDHKDYNNTDVKRGNNCESLKAVKCSSLRCTARPIPGQNSVGSYKMRGKRTSIMKGKSKELKDGPTQSNREWKSKVSSAKRKRKTVQMSASDSSSDLLEEDFELDDTAGHSSFWESDTGSISDIDRLSDDEKDVVSNADLVSPSDDNDFETPPSEDREICTLKDLISCHRKNPDVRLCVVKLFRNLEQDVIHEETGKKVPIYS